MRKLITIALTISMAFMLINCGSPKADTAEIPDWYLNPPQTQDAIHEAGDAAKHSMGLAKEAADARARDGIARTIEIKVSTMFKNFMQESGVGQEAEALEFTSSVSKQVANNVLKGCKITKREMKREGELYHCYSLAKYDLNSLIQETKESARRQKALYNEAKANMAFDELEDEIDNMDSNNSNTE